jgi:hypothetical protein
VTRLKLDSLEDRAQERRPELVRVDVRNPIDTELSRSFPAARLVAAEDDLALGMQPLPAAHGVVLDQPDVPQERLGDGEHGQHVSAATLPGSSPHIRVGRLA